MRDILEEAVIAYRAEVDSFLTLVTPAAGLGLLLLILADTSLAAAFFAVPLLAVVYVGAYAACVQRAGVVTQSGSDEPGAWKELVLKAPHILVAAGPGIVLAIAAGLIGLILSQQGFARRRRSRRGHASPSSRGSGRCDCSSPCSCRWSPRVW
jgi:hypothetical protein